MDTLATTDKIAYRIHEAVTASGLSRSFLYEKIQDGSLKSFKAGGCRLILRADLMGFIAAYASANR